MVFELHQHCKVSQMITAAIRSSAGVVLSFAASLWPGATGAIGATPVEKKKKTINKLKIGWKLLVNCFLHRVQRRCVCRYNIKTCRKPLKNGLFWSRYSFVTHSMDRKPRDWGLARSAYSALRASVVLWATCRAPARIWLGVIDFHNDDQQSRSASDKKRGSRFQ